MDLEKYRNLPPAVAQKEFLEGLEKREWFVEDATVRVDVERTVVAEILAKGGKPCRFHLSVPRCFAAAASYALRKLFPGLKPFSPLYLPVLSVSHDHLNAGYYSADGVLLEVSFGYFSCNYMFTVDETKHKPKDVHEAFVGLLREYLRGKFIWLTEERYGEEEDINGEEGMVATGGEKAWSELPLFLTLNEYLESYPPAVQGGLKRILAMLRVIAQRPASGLFFAALLAGEPGTGKSLFAHLLAREAVEAGMSVLYASGQVRGVELRLVLDYALKTLPSLLVILDECENNILSREIARTEILNYLMTLLDGYVWRTYASFGMLFITNRPHVVEPALLRPQRMEEVVEFTALSDGQLAYSVFQRWCEKLGVSVPKGVNPDWFAGKTHAECAGVAHKLQRMQAFGEEIDAKVVQMLLKEATKWAQTTKFKSTRSRQEGGGMGFSTNL